ncbi:alpha-mannosidase 2x-like isoform X1 [Haliotis asinina]|uniref:alpha-mannosidase 2x-like isoform X1 n=1 Tax=Haliotis asinina TaxID=109174 RepID=UPI0035318749
MPIQLRPRKIKRQISFLYFMLAIFALASLSTYLNYEFLHEGLARKDPLSSKYMQALDGIEVKIKRIEDDIIRNHETIKEIKDTVGKIAKGDRSGIDRLKEVLQLDNPVEVKKPVQHVEQHQERPAQGVVNMEVLSPDQKRDEEKYEVQAQAIQLVQQDVCTWSERPAAAEYQMHEIFELLPFDNPDGGVWKQGWDISYDVNQWSPSNQLQVFVVPHSHCDPGWIKTFEDYYRSQTKPILDNMVRKLEEDKNRKFMYAEISFFSHWWGEVDDSIKKRVKALIDSGQLEIVTGGWVMTDEANAHYFAMIDQLLEGHQWLAGTLGVKPQSGWAIDPFGYSSTMAYILKRTGLKSMLIQRVHYSIKKHLAQKKALEFMWRQQWDDEGGTDMFCHMMPFYSYDVPHTCGPDPKICCTFDFRRLPGSKYKCPWKLNPVSVNDGNVAERSLTLLDQYRKKAQLYKTNVLLIPLGDDFRYDQADEWDKQFSNYQKIFNYINSHSELNAKMQFGTLSDYFNTLYKTMGVDAGSQPKGIPTLSGDFFTYADRDDHYWSGYFTSRPFYKHLDRLMESHLRSGEVIFSMAQSYARKFTSSAFPSVEMMSQLVTARRALGLFQHHDGITGTAKDFVVVDYGNRIVESLANLKRLIVECATYLLAGEKNDFKDKTYYFNVDELRESHDSLPDKTVMELSDNFRSVILYNSMANKRVEVVKVFVNAVDVEVQDPTGKVIHSQIEPFWADTDSTTGMKYKLAFVCELPALGVARYQLRQVAPASNPRHHRVEIKLINAQPTQAIVPSFLVKRVTDSADFSLENIYFKARFSGTTGLLKAMMTKPDLVEHKTETEFVLYGTKNAKEKSGAYLFLPDGVAKPVHIVSPLVRIITGPILSEVHVFTPYAEHVVRVINSPGSDGTGLDVYNVVDVRHLMNKEVAMRISTDIRNQDRVFYTDLNGFQMQRRKTYDKLPLQANFYPMPTMMFIEDSNCRFSILSQQSLGVSSLTQGVVEVILDRRLNQDDNRGLGQGVLDNKRTPNRFRLLIENRRASKEASNTVTLGYPTLVAHLVSLHLTQPIFVMPQKASSPPLTLNPVFTPISQELPCDLHLLNLRTMQNKDDSPELKYVPRDTAALLLHRLAYDCSYPVIGLSCAASNTKVTFENLFKDLKVENLVETSLTLMHDYEELDPKAAIQVDPMEISAFRLKLK